MIQIRSTLYHSVKLLKFRNLYKWAGFYIKTDKLTDDLTTDESESEWRVRRGSERDSEIICHLLSVGHLIKRARALQRCGLHMHQLQTITNVKMSIFVYY